MYKSLVRVCVCMHASKLLLNYLRVQLYTSHEEKLTNAACKTGVEAKLFLPARM